MKTICIDVDGTLIFHDGPDQGSIKRSSGKFKINVILVEQIKKWVQSHTIIVWSARGKDIAEWAVKETGIEKYVSLACAKPSSFVDDHYRWIDRIQKINPLDI